MTIIIPHQIFYDFHVKVNISFFFTLISVQYCDYCLRPLFSQHHQKQLKNHLNYLDEQSADYKPSYDNKNNDDIKIKRKNMSPANQEVYHPSFSPPF